MGMGKFSPLFSCNAAVKFAHRLAIAAVGFGSAHILPTAAETVTPRLLGLDAHPVAASAVQFSAAAGFAIRPAYGLVIPPDAGRTRSRK